VARTTDEILTSYQTSVALTDPTVDTAKGPLYAWVGRPLSKVLAPTEAAVDTLNQTFSAQFALTATAEQAQSFLTNWSETAGLGNPSACPVYFMKFSRPDPNKTYRVPVGALVSNSDQSLQFVTVESGSIIGALADSYYNAKRRAWEIPVNVQAVANGPQYDLPSTLINTKVSQIDGFDTIENRVAAAGGIAAESQASQIERAQEKFLGLDRNSPQGNVTRIKAFNPSVIQDVQIVLSTNRQLFKRLSYIPAADYYILGSLPQTLNETYKSVSGGETLIPLKNVPCLSVNSVTINNVPITNFTLVSDKSLQFGGSTRAADKVMITPALMPGDVVVINQSYDALFSQVQASVFGQTQMFQTDELARKHIGIPVNIALSAKAITNYDATTVQIATQAALAALLVPGFWQGQIQPNDILQSIKTTVQGLSNPVFQTFQRSTGALTSIETLLFSLAEIAVYDPHLISITIKSS